MSVLRPFKRRPLGRWVLSAVVVIVTGVYCVSGAFAEDLPAIEAINPVPRGLPLSPVIAPDGRFVMPRSGPLEAIQEQFIIIGDVRFHMASEIRFLRNREGFAYGIENFTPGTFVEYLLNDARQVIAVWPAPKS